MDLFEDDGPDPEKGNAPEFTVSELTGSVKKTLEAAFGRVRVRGEVGRVITARSGHMYYDIKDDRNVIACNTWKGQVAGLGVIPEEGLEVIVTGKLSTFGPQSKYNINVDSVEVAGAGALMAMLEKRKQKLAAEGLFDVARKKPLPYLPEIIGVVTSPTGAVIRDILHRLRDRFPRKVLVWPVAVQGANSAPEVAHAVAGFNAMSPGGALPRPDLIIVARGGGSIEDLWGFNEESVARAVAASDIPVISAVGHETDTTLIDFVSDMRAPTPTAAAELAVPVRMELRAHVDQQGARLLRALSETVGRRGERLRDLARALPRPEELTGTARQQLDRWGERLPVALRGATAAKRVQLARHDLKPASLNRAIGQSRRRLEDLSARLTVGPRRRVEADRQRLERITLKRPDLSIRRDRLAARADRLAALARQQQEARANRLQSLDRLRLTLGYEATLERGYAVVWDGDTLVTTTKGAKAARTLEVQFRDGRVPVGGPAKPARKPKDPPDGQGSLL